MPTSLNPEYSRRLKRCTGPSKAASWDTDRREKAEDILNLMQADNQNQQPGPSSDSTRGAGKWMIIGVWVLLLGLMTLFAHRWYERAENPNQTIFVGQSGDGEYIRLQANRAGHYVANGQINGKDVVFLLDTGATSISVPQQVADRVGLSRGHPVTVSTANGTATVYATSMEAVRLGVFERYTVAGHVNPHMRGDEVLLGMNFLRHFNLNVQDTVLTITQP